MLSRRRFLCRGVGATLGLSGGGLLLNTWAQDENLARGMITPQTQEAIDSGLAYLSTTQNPDGSWGTGQHRGSVAITALAGLAFMAGGHQPGRGRYGRLVANAVDYILRNEDPNGPPGYIHNRSATMHGPMYGHGFATLFLAEVHGMIPNMDLKDKVRATLERSVKLIVTSQNKEGGWRYRPEPNDADISVTICQIMALRAARNAGFAVPKSVADGCTKYVKDCQELRGDGAGGFRYQRFGGQVGFARTAAGVVALYSAGIYEGEAVDKGLDFMMKYKPGNMQRTDREYHIHYYYGHYYAAQAMWTAGGRFWREWFPAIREELLRPIANGGHRSPNGSWYNNNICPHYCTAMALIVLQIPNNYLPILQR